MQTRVWAVGTTNKAKLSCVDAVANKVFPNDQHEVISVNVPSGISDQPLSAEETIEGATNRARRALEAVPSAHFGIGLEGGVERIGDRWFECGWMAVIERSSGRLGIGSSARFEMSAALTRPLFEEGKELAEVIDDLTGCKDVRSGQGAMGVLTGGHLCRGPAYEHGLIFALAPFLSDERFWKTSQ